jgi:YHS domain-containing protein
MRFAILTAAVLLAACTKNAAPTPSAEAELEKREHLASAADVPLAFDQMPPPGTAARCPVSGALVVVGPDTPHSEFQGKTYVSCCPDCKQQFDAQPTRYLAANARPVKAVKGGGVDVSQEAPNAFSRIPSSGTKARCAVTGESFVVSEDTVHSEYLGKTYVFCCPPCKAKFDAHPASYSAK